MPVSPRQETNGVGKCLIITQMTVFIYYTGSPNFRVIITQLQPQLDPDSDIYIVDTTKDRSGVKLAKLYGSTRCYIFVEVGDYSWDKAYGFAEQNMRENKQEGILNISENSVISNTFISNLKKATKFEFEVVYPVTIEALYDQFPNDFKWYNSSTLSVKNSGFTEISCFYRKAKGKGGVGLFSNETVVLLPTNTPA